MGRRNNTKGVVEMSVIDVKDMIETDVDLQAEFTKQGLSVSVIIGDEEIEHTSTYEDMAIDMVGDSEKYDNETLKKIAQGLDYMSKFIKESIGKDG